MERQVSRHACQELLRTAPPECGTASLLPCATYREAPHDEASRSPQLEQEVAVGLGSTRCRPKGLPTWRPWLGPPDAHGLLRGTVLVKGAATRQCECAEGKPPRANERICGESSLARRAILGHVRAQAAFASAHGCVRSPRRGLGAWRPQRRRRRAGGVRASHGTGSKRPRAHQSSSNSAGRRRLI